MWECKYCLKEFKREGAFLKHECKQMRVFNELSEPHVQAAYSYYSYWMKQRGFKVPDIQTYGTSRYYNTFKKFHDFIQQYKIPSPEKYMDIMIRLGLSPMLWSRDEYYSSYLRNIDKLVDPVDQAIITIEFMMKLMKDKDLSSPSDLLRELHYREIVDHIRARKFSPWLLLCSKAFRDKLSSLEASERVEVGRIIGMNYYATEFEKNPKTLTVMKEIANKIEI